MMLKKTYLAAATAAMLVGANANAVDIQFNFDFDGSGLDANQISLVEASFTEAAALWEARLTDNVVVTVNAGFDVLGANVLASAGSNAQSVSYSQFRDALIADRTSLNDKTAVANIPLESLSYLTNTLEADLVPDGDPAQQIQSQATNFQGGNTASDGSMLGHSHFSGCAHWDTMVSEAGQKLIDSSSQHTGVFDKPNLNVEEPPFEEEDVVIQGVSVTLDSVGTSFFDSDNFNIEVNTANLKAVGLGDLVDPNASDASINFNSLFFDSFDFDRTDGIQGQDFVSIAAHEIGHALGFVSSVDFADILTGDGPVAQLAASLLFNSNPGLTSLQGLGVGMEFFGGLLNPLDLFKYSSASFDANGNFIGNDLTTGLFNPEVLFNLTSGGTLALNATDVCEGIANGEFADTVPYLSIDGGVTSIAPMSSGSFNGINAFASANCAGQFGFFGANQASHFLETGFNPAENTIGLMDPQLPGNLSLDPFATDLLAFDVIGWDIAKAFQTNFVNGPATIGLFGLALTVIGLRRRKARKV